MELVNKRLTSSLFVMAQAETVFDVAEHVSVRRSRKRSVAACSDRSGLRRAPRRDRLVIERAGMLEVTGR